jgi:hypothetical protein
VHRLAKMPNIGTVQSFFVLHEAKKDTAYVLNLPEQLIKQKSVVAV